MGKYNLIFLEILPILIAVLLVSIFNKELELFVIGIILVGYTFFKNYESKEIYLFVLGMFVGLILELVGNFYLGQKWAEATFFTIPIWLPILWGYGFLIIRRVGNILVK